MPPGREVRYHQTYAMESFYARRGIDLVFQCDLGFNMQPPALCSEVTRLCVDCIHVLANDRSSSSRSPESRYKESRFRREVYYQWTLPLLTIC